MNWWVAKAEPNNGREDLSFTTTPSSSGLQTIVIS
jgi:hypothetical protein